MKFDADDLPVNSSSNPDLQQIVERMMSRRTLLKAGLGIATIPFFGALAACGSNGDGTDTQLVGERQAPPLDKAFAPVAASTGDSILVADGYVAEVMYRWGDPLTVATAHEWRGDASEGWVEQENQAGDNHDGISFFSLPGDDDANRADTTSGLLVMNHEYVNYEYFFQPGGDPADWLAPWTADKAKKALAAHGISVIEVRRGADGRWEYVRGSRHNRRLTGYSPMELTGPAAGAPALRTADDATGTRVLGTLNNCANGRTPWGTYLTCEENFNGYFGTTDATWTPDTREARYGVGTSSPYRWHEVDERFDIARNPNEPNRFGWIVEIDPFDPLSTPKKRTALGRMKHENAELVLAGDGRVVVYMGDDQTFEYIYKFVSDGRYDAANPVANRDLLDRGTLYVARFDAGTAADGRGTGTWVPLVHGDTVTGASFSSQADVLIDTRSAADEVGATKMDRPEWIAAHPKRSGEVYCTLTNNSARGRTGQPGVDAANPRSENRYGQIVRWVEEGGDPAATTFAWDLFLIAGNPIAHPDRGDLRSGSALIDETNTFNSPDGLVFDDDGRLWIQSDGNFSNSGDYAGQGNNQMLVADPDSAELVRFFVGPDGCEVTGLAFTPDMRAMFVNIQHPGEVGSHPRAPRREDGSPYGDNDIAHEPTAFSRWPDGVHAGRPRSATVVVRRADGGRIGS